MIHSITYPPFATLQESHDRLIDQVETLQSVLIEDWDAQPTARILTMLCHLRDYFDHNLLPHFREEEWNYFPRIEELPNGDAKVARLHREHHELREAIEELRSGLILAYCLGDDSCRALLRRLVNDARSLCARLTGHMLLENDLVRECSDRHWERTRLGSAPGIPLDRRS